MISEGIGFDDDGGGDGGCCSFSIMLSVVV